MLNDLDVVKKLANSAATNLGWRPRSPQEAILSGAKSLIDLGVVYQSFVLLTLVQDLSNQALYR